MTLGAQPAEPPVEPQTSHSPYEWTAERLRSNSIAAENPAVEILWAEEIMCVADAIERLIPAVIPLEPFAHPYEWRPLVRGYEYTINRFGRDFIYFDIRNQARWTETSLCFNSHTLRRARQKRERVRQYLYAWWHIRTGDWVAEDDLIAHYLRMLRIGYLRDDLYERRSLNKYAAFCARLLLKSRRRGDPDPL